VLWILFVGLACAPVSSRVPEHAEANKFAGEDRISLSLRVINDTAARGLEYPKALEVTLRNGLAGRDIWAEGKMALPPGTLDLEVRTENGTRVTETCLRNLALSKAWDYVVLAGGSAITRVVRLGNCYRVPDDQPLLVSVRYHNDAVHVPGSPHAWIPLFRGPVTSNTVTFVMRGDIKM
jgi:hypothetical protein